MHPYKRSQRVQDLIKEEVSDIILSKLKDPRVGFITVTGAQVSDDLKFVRIFVSVFDKKDSGAVLNVLNSARGFIKRELARVVKLKRMPDIEFFEDSSYDYGQKIENLLKQAKGEGS